MSDPRKKGAGRELFSGAPPPTARFCPRRSRARRVPLPTGWLVQEPASRWISVRRSRNYCRVGCGIAVATRLIGVEEARPSDPERAGCLYRYLLLVDEP